MATRRSRGIAALAGCLLTSAALAAQHVPNHIKYSDTGIRNGTGRSGNGTLEAQALLGSDGAVDLTLTSNGTLDKVQLKLGDAAQNFPGVAGSTFTQRLEGLGRHSRVQIQANVSGVDANRTDVVEATEIVKLRPDVRVESLRALPHGVAGVPMQIIALLREANGDAGARANCILTANGVEVDRANGIWVDAHGSVACEFQTTFRDAGAKELVAIAADVNPGDYDASNNSATASVTIYAAATPLEVWSAGADERNWTRFTYDKAPNWESTREESGGATGTWFIATLPGDFDIDRIKVSAAASTDGNPLFDLADVPFQHERSYDWDWDVERNCALHLENNVNVSSCRVRGPWGNYTTFYAGKSGGDVTYHSHGWFRDYTGATQPHQHDQYIFSGPRLSLGNTVSMDIHISDGASYRRVQPFVTLAPYGSTVERPRSCWFEDQYCFEYRETVSGRIGTTSSHP